MARLIPPEVERRSFSQVVKAFVAFANHEVFKNRPKKGMSSQLLDISNGKKVAKESCIDKVDFGCLHNSFRKIFKIGGQNKNKATCFQYRNPLFNCRYLNPDEVGNIGKIHCCYLLFLNNYPIKSTLN
jgi:hypothetical protein